MKDVEQRAVEAMRTFPLPKQSGTSIENYRRILDWLYRGAPSGRDPASIVIDLELEERHSWREQQRRCERETPAWPE
jgi:hypothetical protein